MTIRKGEMRIEVSTVMETADHIAVEPDAAITPVAALPQDALVYLLQSRYCPSDKMEAQTRGLVDESSSGYAQVESIRAWIHQNLEYKYGEQWQHRRARHARLWRRRLS